MKLDMDEIERLLEEVSVLARQDIARRTFHEAYLQRWAAALGATNGAIWVADPQSHVRLEVRLSDGESQFENDTPDVEQDVDAVQRIWVSGKPRLALPTDGPESACRGLCPLKCGEQVVAVADVKLGVALQSVDANLWLQVAYSFAELADDFYTRDRMRELQQRDGNSGRFRDFIKQINAESDINRCAYSIANDGRRLVGCDRLSVLGMNGKRPSVLAISGVESIDPRSEQVRYLENIARHVVQSGRAIVWDMERGTVLATTQTGNAEIEEATQADTDLATRMDNVINDYKAYAEIRSLAVIPLKSPRNSSASGNRPVGAMIAEQFETRPTDALLESFNNAADFAAQAMANAIRSRGRLLTRMARAIESLLTLPRLSKLTVALLVFAGAGFALTMIPAEFEVTVRGQLQPAVRRDVFAPRQGVVKRLFVPDDLNVEQHAQLLVLEDADLEFQIEQFDGDLRTTTQSLAATRARLGTSTTPGTVEHDQLAADVSELEERVQNLKQLINALKKQRDQLHVASPISGRVLTADFKELLSDRPVQPGQVLLRVADVDGLWVLELNVPDQDIGHVLSARSDSDGPLGVNFLLATNPAQTYTEVLGEIGETTELFDGETPSVRVVVPVINSRLDTTSPRLTNLRPGATVIAKIQCGERPLGIVWFHEIIEFVQSRVLF